MTEPLESDLITALIEQTHAINRLADSNEALLAIIYQNIEQQYMDDDIPEATYLNGKPIR